MLSVCVRPVVFDFGSKESGWGPMADPREQNAAEVWLNRLLNLILETAVEVLGFDGATVTARHDKQLATVGATDQRLITLDDAQCESGEGPCLAVLDRRDPIALDDAAELDDQQSTNGLVGRHPLWCVMVESEALSV
jgi:hypothetical protein